MDTATLTHSCHKRAQRAQGPSGASVPAGLCMRPGNRSSRHSCPPPDGSSGIQLWERYGKPEGGGEGTGKGWGWADGGYWRKQGEGCGKGAEGPEDRTTRLGTGLTIVGVNTQLNLPLNCSLDLLLPHTLDTQVVKAGGGCI